MASLPSERPREDGAADAPRPDVPPRADGMANAPLHEGTASLPHAPSPKLPSVPLRDHGRADNRMRSTPAPAPALARYWLPVLLLVVILLQSRGVRRRLGLARRPRLRAGCVPLRVLPSGVMEVLLVRSRNNPEIYIFPGGGIEANETAQQAALREVKEEAGMVGRLGRCLGQLDDGRTHTTMFVLHVEEELETFDEMWRERRWFSLGVPGSPRAGAAIDAARAQLSPKQVHRHYFARLEELGAELLRDGEMAEQRAREGRTGSRARGATHETIATRIFGAQIGAWLGRPCGAAPARRPPRQPKLSAAQQQVAAAEPEPGGAGGGCGAIQRAEERGTCAQRHAASADRGEDVRKVTRFAT